MPAIKSSAVKDLKELNYGSWDELCKVATLPSDTLDKRSSKNLLNSTKGLFDKAKSYDSIHDEEQAYILYSRYYEVLLSVSKRKDFAESDRQYVTQLFSCEMKSALVRLEELQKSLQRRFELKRQMDELDSRENAAVVENENANSNAAVAIKAKVGGDSSEMTAGSSPEDVNNGDIGAAKMYLMPEELHDMIQKKSNILIIDIRPKKDFVESHIDDQNCISVPEEILKSGITASHLECDLFYESRSKFSMRDKVDTVVILDWSSTLQSITTNCPFQTMMDAIFLYDHVKLVKKRPLLLHGGYERWLKFYPQKTTNPAPKRSQPFDRMPSVSSASRASAITYPSYFDAEAKPIFPSLTNRSLPDKCDASSDGNDNFIMSSNSHSDTFSNGAIQYVEACDSKVAYPSLVSTDDPLDRIAHASSASNADLKVEDNSPLPQQELADLGSNTVNSSSNSVSYGVMPLPDRSKKPVLKPVIPASSTVAIPEGTAPVPAKLPPTSVPAGITVRNKDYDDTKGEYIELSLPSTSERPKPRPPPERTDYVTIIPSKPSGDAAAPRGIIAQKESLSEASSSSSESLGRPSEPSTQKKSLTAGEIQQEAERLRKLKAVKNGPTTESSQTVSQPHAGDQDVTYERLRTEGSGGSGMRRSLSSPNVEKLGLDISQQLNLANEAKRPGLVVNRALKPTDAKSAHVQLDPSELENSLSPQLREFLHRTRNLQGVSGSAAYPFTVGLRNLGNTCFMNSIIQCLVHTVPLYRYMVSMEFLRHINVTNHLGTKGQIAVEFFHVLKALSSGGYKSIAPADFKNCVSHHQPMFAGYQQHDSQEFLTFLLDSLHEDLNQVTTRIPVPEQNNDERCDMKVAARTAWQYHLAQNSSKIVDLFQGQYKSTVQCQSCRKQSVTFETFMHLTLPVPKKNCSLADCFALFSQPEKMTGDSRWKCPDCGVYRDASKHIELWRLPTILLIHLKRFVWEGRWRSKLNTNVSFPVKDFDATSYVKGEKPTKKYNLYALSHHSGTLEGGHYIAYCKNPDGNAWRKFDDNLVTGIEESNLRGSGAYILFYTM